MRTHFAQSSLLAALVGGSALLVAPYAHASNPLEYPDNGAAQFSRGGAWLATANEPIATHYNPAALATQASAFSIDVNLNLNKVCYDRKGPGNTPTGPNEGSNPALIYQPVCNSRSSFPNTIPSIAIAWRATKSLGFGFAIVPPATYGTADSSLPLTSTGYNTFTKKPQVVPAPYRYQGLNELSTIIFPTLSVGYELFSHFRVGVGFVSGIADINTQAGGIANIAQPSVDQPGDHSTDDSIATIQTHDLFVPGVVGSLHWSVLPNLDLSVWGRWMDAVKTSTGIVDAVVDVYNTSGTVNPTCSQDITTAGASNCKGVAHNIFPSAVQRHGNALAGFKYPIPPEIRVGARFHQPRGKSRLAFADGGEVRDPLHDDVFDVEVDGSYTMNSVANVIQVRFVPFSSVAPTGVPLPLNADRLTGYENSVGLRVGGQWNALQDKLGVRAGGWMETQSQDPAYLTISPVGGMRWGVGGGVVFRQDFIDISFGYQLQQNAGLNNYGNGKLLAPVGTGGTPAFRSYHAVNGGSVTQSANAFTLGGTVRF